MSIEITVHVDLAEVLRIIFSDPNLPYECSAPERALEVIDRFVAPQPDILVALDALHRDIQIIKTNQGAIMANIDNRAAQLTADLESIKQQNQKSFAEIRTALEAQITPEELAAAVEAAKVETRSTVEAENDAAVDRAFAPLMQRAAEAKEAAQAIDDLVADAPVEPPVEPQG